MGSTEKITLSSDIETTASPRSANDRPDRKRLYLAVFLLITTALLFITAPIAGFNPLLCMREKPTSEIQTRRALQARATESVASSTSKTTSTSTLKQTTTATVGTTSKPTSTTKLTTTSTITSTIRAGNGTYGITNGTTNGTTNRTTNGTTNRTTNGTTNGTNGTINGTSWWKPKPKATWQISLSELVKVTKSTPNNSVFDIDLFDTSTTTITALKAKGNKVICYFSAGTYENWRPDVKSFPKAVIGKALKGWTGENWIDTRAKTTRAIMTTRIKLAKSKGCDAVDPDNVDGYSVSNQTGFSLTAKTAVDYIKFLADTAHAHGLGVGLKNAPDLVGATLAKVDFEVNESCVQYGECSKFQPFIKANKSVFHIEYVNSAKPVASFVKNACFGKGTTGFSTVIKHSSLNLWTKSC